MLAIKHFIFGLIQTNTYVISDEQGNALLFDPACQTPSEQQQLLRYLQSLNSNLSSLRIIATHGHFDHLWGAAWATEQFGQPVLVAEADIPLAQHIQEQYNLFGIDATAQAFPIQPLSEEVLALGEHQFTIIPTPGHTPGSICLHEPNEKILISGDTLFHYGYGRTDLPGGSYEQLLASLERLAKLPADTMVYPGHGEIGLITL